jgi:hypothetical protein
MSIPCLYFLGLNYFLADINIILNGFVSSRTVKVGYPGEKFKVVCANHDLYSNSNTFRVQSVGYQPSDSKRWICAKQIFDSAFDAAKGITLWQGARCINEAGRAYH